MSSLSLPGGLTAAQQTLLASLSTGAIVNPATADSIADILAMIVDRSVLGNTPAGHAVVANSIAAMLAKIDGAAMAAVPTANSIADALGRKSDAASATGSGNAKLAALMPLVQGTTSVSVVRPDLASALTLTDAAGVWTYGTYTEVAAANDLAAHALIAMTVRAITDTQYQMQIATGGAGSEVVIGTYRIHSDPTVTDSFYVPIWPYLFIPANARVAARVASGTGGLTLAATFTFIPRPLA